MLVKVQEPTGVKSIKITEAANGLSAYQLAVKNDGFQGDYAAWRASLNGDDFEYAWNGTKLGVKTDKEETFTEVELKGDQGIQGIQGVKGDKGDIAIQGEYVSYPTLAAAQAVNPKPVNGTMFHVEETANKGVYTFQSGEAGGTRFERLHLTPSQLGHTRHPALTNFLSELTSSSITDSAIWGSGYLQADGKVFNDGLYKHTVKYYRVEQGEYRFAIRLYGNAKAIFYDRDYNIISSWSGMWSSFSTYDLTVPANAVYFRTSFYGDNTTLPNVYLKNNNVLTTIDYPHPLGAVKTVNSTTPVSGKKITEFYKNSLKAIHPPKPTPAIISFVADDGRDQSDEWYIPALDAKGVKGTFAIVSDWVEKNRVYTNAYNLQKIKDLYNAGHDIASHTKTHPRLYSDLTLPQAEEELRASKFELMRMGINAEVFVAPYADRNVEVDKLIRKYYKCDFGIGVADGDIVNCANKPPIDNYLLKRVAFDASTNGVSRLQICKDAVDVIVANGGWLTFMVHPHFDEYSATKNTSGYVARRQELTDLITYIQGLNVPIITAKQGFEFYSNPVNIGNNRLDTKYYALGMDGTEAGNYFD